MKKVFLAIIFISAIAGIYLRVASPTLGTESGEELVQVAFRASGAKFQGDRVQGWAVMPGTGLSQTKLADLARRAALTLGGGAGNLSVSTRQDPQFAGTTLEGWLDGATHLQIIAQSVEGVPGTASTVPETFLLVSVDNSSLAAELTAWDQKLRRLFKDLGMEPRISKSMTGTFPGRLSREEKEGRISEALKAAKARRVEGMTEGELISVSAYSPLLSDTADVAGRLVNLNIAVRYHSNEDLTYLEIGSPLLDGEY